MGPHAVGSRSGTKLQVVGLASWPWPLKVNRRKWRLKKAAVGRALRASATETSVCSSLASWKHGRTWDDALVDGEQTRQFLGQGGSVWTTREDGCQFPVEDEGPDRHCRAIAGRSCFCRVGVPPLALVCFSPGLPIWLWPNQALGVLNGGLVPGCQRRGARGLGEA